MSRLTKDLVFTAINELKENHLDVTVIALRDQLNGRGSYSTISKYLKEYLEQNVEEVEQAAEAAIPTVDSLNVPAEIRQQAVEAAEKQLVILYSEVEKTFLSSKLKIQEDFDDRVSQVKAELAKKIEEVEQVVLVSEKQEKQIESLTEALEAERVRALAELEQANTDKSAQLAKITKLEILNDEAKKSTKQLNIQIVEARDALVAEKTEHAVTGHALDSANLSKGSLENQLQRANNLEREQIKKTSELENEIKTTNMALNTANETRDSYKTAKKDLAQQLRETENKLIELTTQNKMYQTQMKQKPETPEKN
jgi:chromosome segregation ATPase